MQILEVVDISKSVVKFYLGKNFTGVLDDCEVLFLRRSITHLTLVDTARQRWPINFLGKVPESLSDQVLLDLKLFVNLNLDLPFLLNQVHLFNNLVSRWRLLRFLIAWRKLCNLVRYIGLRRLSLFLLLLKILLGKYCWCILLPFILTILNFDGHDFLGGLRNTHVLAV